MAVAVCALAACDDDIDKWKVSGLSQSQVELETADNVVISKSNLSSTVLQMTYTADGRELYLTNSLTGSAALGEGTYTLQISTSADFSGTVKTESLPLPIKGVNDISYTGQELNILAMSLGLEAGKAGKLYFRTLHGYNASDNRNVVESEALTVGVTPLYIDMTLAFVLDKDKTATVDTLYSPTENGIYEGFIGTYGGWFNFWVSDGMEQVWGNYGEDGNFARADMAANGAWNFWTAEPAGCLLLSLNTNGGNQYITYTEVDTLSVRGDATANLTFDAATVKWAGIVETTKDDAQLYIDGKTITNDNGTGDAAKDGRKGTLTLSPDADGKLTRNATPQTAIGVATAGKYKIEIDLSGAVPTYTLTDMGDVKTYPSEMFVVIGGVKTSLTAEMNDGIPTGTYSGVVNNTTAGAAYTIEDGDGNAYFGESTLTFDEVAEYEVNVNLPDNSVSAVAKSKYAASLGIYYDADHEWIQSTLYSDYASTNPDGLYRGLLYKDADDWNFHILDSNGNSWGVDSGWNQHTFQKGSTNNFWVTATQTSYYVRFEAENDKWSEFEVTSLHLVGDFNNFKFTTPLTNNGDGTWTLTDLTISEKEKWGPYLVVNEDWLFKLYLATDNTSLTAEQTSNYIGSEPGTYDIVVSAKTNSVTITKK